MKVEPLRHILNQHQDHSQVRVVMPSGRERPIVSITERYDEEAKKTIVLLEVGK